MSQLKKLFGDTVIYGASSIFGRAINFLLVPLYTAVFAPEDYGVVTELYAYVAFLMVFYLYGVETTFFRFATKYDDQTKYYNISVTNALIISILLSSAIISSSDWLGDTLPYTNASKYIVWLALILALDTLVAVPFARLRLESKAKRFALFKISNILVNITLNLFFLLFCPYWVKENPDSSEFIQLIYNPSFGVGYVFVSNLAASASTALFFLPYWVKFRIQFDREKWKEMFHYATPLVIIGLAGVTNEMLSRLLLRHWLPEGYYSGFSNIAVLGIFGACYKLSMLMNLSVQSFRYAYEPFFFSRSKDRNSPELFAKVMNAFIIYGCLAFILISLILPEVAPIILRQSDYLTALHIVPILLFSGLLLGIFYNLSVWYKLTDKTIYGAYITIIGAVLTIVFNWILIPVLGYEGSALTALLAYLVMVVVSYVWGQRNFHVPYQLTKGLFYLLYSSVLVGIICYLQLESTAKYIFGLSALGFFIILVLAIERPRKSIQ
ncbi:MAG: oligosaccharide flippase family protein [Cytophagales bacterium]|nr:oligosaccharide flippase family protein [Cytophagales bacterium]